MPGSHQTLALKVPVGLEHRVRIDRQLGDNLLSRRQLVARFEQAKLQGLMNLLDQLQIGGDTGSGVQLKLDHNHSSTNQLVEVC